MPARLLRDSAPDAAALTRMLREGEDVAGKLHALVVGWHELLEGVYRHYAVTTEHWSYQGEERRDHLDAAHAHRCA